MGPTHGWTGPALDWVHALLLTALGFLMISRFPYSSFKSINFDRRVPFVRMLSIVAVLGLIALDRRLRSGVWLWSTPCRDPCSISANRKGQPGGRLAS
ncbi:MAG: hypothetical protein CM15mP92_0900 [Halieaceae bacterium]|nr:MAG: hypothetical protein CM15mP92_0900 [Halieaceae bacterium]